MNWQLVFYKIDTHEPAPWPPIRDLTRESAEDLRNNPDYFTSGVYAVARPQATDART